MRNHLQSKKHKAAMERSKTPPSEAASPNPSTSTTTSGAAPKTHTVESSSINADILPPSIIETNDPSQPFTYACKTCDKKFMSM